VTVPISEIERFKLRYAKSQKYGWLIPAYTLSTMTHGILLIFSATVNLIVTTSVTASGDRAYKYSNKNFTYDQLKMFSRFPQGIPENIDRIRL